MDWVIKSSASEVDEESVEVLRATRRGGPRHMRRYRSDLSVWNTVVLLVATIFTAWGVYYVLGNGLSGPDVWLLTVLSVVLVIVVSICVVDN